MRKKIMLAAIALLCSILLMADDDALLGNVSSVNLQEDNLFVSMQDNVKARFQSENSDICWVGYKFTSRSGFDVHFGSDKLVTINGSTISYTSNHGECDGIEKVTSTDRGVLFCFEKKGNRAELCNIKILDLTARYRFNVPLLWDDSVAAEASITNLENLLNDNSLATFHEDLSLAIVLHPGDRPMEIVKGFILSDAEEENRAEALTLFAMAGKEKYFDDIIEIDKKITSIQMREQLPLAYYLTHSQRRVERLSNLARTERNEDVRDDAFFWLGMLAREKVTGTGKVHGEEDGGSFMMIHGILDNPKGKDLLFKLAKNGKNDKVKGDAIFWLCSEYHDEETLDFLTTLLK